MATDNNSNTSMTKSEDKTPAKIDENYLKDNANVGLEDIKSEDLPTPSIILIQKNSDITDDDGRPLPRGKFLYRGTNQVMDEVHCSFLSVTKTELPDYVKKDEMVKTYVLLGALEPDWRPFVMYMNKTKMQTVRNFLGQVTTSKTPMFAQKVKITSEEVNSQKGDYYTPQIKLMGLRESMEEIVLLEDMAKTYGSRLKEQIKEVDFEEPAQ